MDDDSRDLEPLEGEEPQEEEDLYEEFFSIPGDNVVQPDAGVRRKIKIMIAIAVAVILTNILVIYIIASNQQTNSSTTVHDSEALRPASIDSAAVTASDYVTEIPDLEDLFGKTQAEVAEALGDSYSLSGMESAGSKNSTKMRATYVYTPDGSSVMLDGMPRIVLGYGANDRVVYAYFTSSMDMVGIPDVSFEELVATRYALADVVRQSGAGVGIENYKVPDPEDYEVYEDDGVALRVLTAKSQTFEGTMPDPGLPDTWHIVFTYRYDGEGGHATGSTTAPARVLEVALW